MRFLSAALLLLATLATCQAQAPYNAIAIIRGTPSASALTGWIKFTQPTVNDLVTVTLQMSGFAATAAGNKHAVHVHTYGDVSDPALPATLISGHFNPTGAVHGCFPNATRHLGDLLASFTVENTSATASPINTYTFQRDLIHLGGPDGTDAASIIGRAIIVHAQEDQCTETGNGNAGPYVAGGVIGIAAPATFGQAATDSSPAYVSFTNPPASAIATLFPTGKATTPITGTVQFVQLPDGRVTVITDIKGLPPNTVHALHGHVWGDASDQASAGSAGGHYNPYNKPHAYPDTIERHMGDMGNVTADATGAVYDVRTFNLLTLTGMSNMIGRAVVLHAGIDDGHTQPTGIDGAAVPGPERLAMGVIGISSQASRASGSGGVSYSSSSSSTGGNAAYSLSPSNALLMAAVAVLALLTKC